MLRASPAAWRVLALLASLCLVATACSDSSSQSSKPTAVGQPGSRPNIVFILTDDLSMNLVPYMPHVQALANSGTTFRNYFVVDSLCCPSRTAIFTGQYPHNNGIFTNVGADGGYAGYNRFGDARKSFAIALHAAGYRTGIMGKYLNGYESQFTPAAGWDTWDVAGNGYPEYKYWVNENGKQVYYGAKPKDYLNTVLTQKASQFIQGAHSAGKPFALEVATFTPHLPWVPAPQDVGTFPTLGAPRGPAFDHTPANAPNWLKQLPPLSAADIKSLDVAFRRRVEAVQSVDRMIAQLEQLLAKTGELRNTYFVFSSDNGFHHGEYRMLLGKTTAFDTDIKVPLVVTGPGVPAGHTVAALASSIDLAPTFLTIAGAKPTDRPDGVSLLPLLHGARPPTTWQTTVLIEHHGPAIDPRDPDRQSSRWGNPPSYEAMRATDFLYVEYVTGEREYYDLRRDPSELNNLAPKLSAVRLQALHKQLMSLERCHGAAACQRAAAPVG